MSRNGITPEQVFEAAQALAGSGKPITVQAVREAVGSGSFNTVFHHLRQWRRRNQDTAQTMPLPPEIEAAAVKAVSFVWAAASQIAHREIETVRTAARTQLDEVQVQTEEAVQEITRREGLAQEKAAHIATLQPLLAAAKDTIAAHAAKIEQLSARIAELKADLDRARALNDERIEKSGRLRGELAAYAVQAPSGTKKPASRPAAPA